MLFKFLIFWFLIWIGLGLLTRGIEYLYYESVFKRIRNMKPEEKHQWEKQILEECRQKAYREKNFELVDQISNLLEEKYND